MCSVEDDATLLNPGPGAYSPSIRATTIRTGSPEFTLKSRFNTEVRANISPAPGTYELPSAFSRQKGCTLSGRNQDYSLKTDSPGPGAYSPKRKNQGRNISFSGRTNLIPMGEDVPAPGSYDVVGQFGSTKPKITLGGRTSTGMPDPGPGFAYDPKLPKKTGYITFAGRTALQGERTDSPGPGAYNQPAFATSSPKVSLSSRYVDIASRPTHDVGPGAYASPERAYKYCYKSGGSFTLAGRTTDVFAKNNAVPGPGNYQIPSNFSSPGRGVALAGRTEIKVTSEIPGPGAYSPLRARTKTAPSLSGRTFKPGVSDWEIRKYMDAPAPGTYEVTRQQKGRMISMASRHENGFRNDNPGPGTYEEFKSRRGGGVSLAGRTEIRSAQGNDVGPGSYNLGSTLKKGGISISGRPKKRGGIITD